MKPLDIVLLALSATIAIFGFFYGKSVKKKLSASKRAPKKLKRLNNLSFLLSICGSWFFIVRLLTVIFCSENMSNNPSWILWGHNISYMMFFAWIIMVVLIILAIIARIYVIPKFTEVPKGTQNLLETIVEATDKYIVTKVGKIGANLGTFITTVVAFIIAYVAIIISGIRTPIVNLLFSVAIAAFGFLFGKSVRKKLQATENQPKKLKILNKLCFIPSIAGSWLFTVQIITMIFGSVKRGEFNVELNAEKWMLFGHSISSTIIITWVIMIVLITLSLIARIFVIPKFTDKPKGIQNVLEIMVESIDKYTNSTVEGIGVNLGAYIFTIALFMISCAAVELLGIRSPTADLTMTAAMALITFVLINYYGIKRKGVGGRIKSLAVPTPLVLPIKIITDCAIPVSLACRLFGNMLGGLIVMDLIYYALGSNAVGIPSVLGLYFNVFHPLIQAFIFVTLTLTFINEAVETTES